MFREDGFAEGRAIFFVRKMDNALPDVLATGVNKI